MKSIITITLTLLFLVSIKPKTIKSDFTEEKKINNKPNIIVIFLDDSGWSDFNYTENDNLITPNVAELASEGCTYENFYVPQAICSASRAAMLTGSYPGRTKIFGALKPKERGLENKYPTLGEIFKGNGYKTALFGKWHLGDQNGTRPHDRGFDETLSLLYSNDMWKHHPERPDIWGKYPLQLWKNGKVEIKDVSKEDQKELTKLYTNGAVEFIKKNKNNPFLIYLPHSMPHVPLYCSDDFKGKSGKGLYSDVLLELDWSVGEINKTLKENGLDDNTIVIFTSDNGPWLSYGNHAGKTPFREGKRTSFDGGIRTFCIIKYPPKIKPNTTSNTIFSSIDLLPTLTSMSNITLKNTIDGKNVWDVLSGTTKMNNHHRYYAISNGKELQAIIEPKNKWKLHLEHKYVTIDSMGNDGYAGKYHKKLIEKSLFNLEKDPYEKINVIKENPEVSKQLSAYADEHLKKFYSKNN